MNIRAIIADNYSYEKNITLLLSFLYLSFIILIVIKTTKTSLKQFSVKINLWLLISLVLLLAYLVVPNSIEGLGGHLSVRILIPLHLFLLVWFAVISYKPIVKKISLIVSILVTVLLINRYYYQIENLNINAKQIEESAKYIKPNSIVLPINQSQNWMQNHFTNYLGVTKPLVILENYEVSSKMFPLIWNKTEMPKLTLGENEVLKCTAWPSGTNDDKKIDYIFIWGKSNNECINDIESNSDYIINKKINNKIRLYKLKNNY